jgi:predicted RNA-binding protein YlqC (UPF0109 family)
MNQEIIDFLKDYIYQTVTKLVDQKDKVEILISLTTKTIIIQIRSEKTDIGKIIGSKGRIIESLKIIISSIKNANFPNDPRKISLEILEDENSSYTYNR